MKLWDCFIYWREDVLARARRQLWESAGVAVEMVAFVGDRTHRGNPYTGPPVPPGIRVESVTLDGPDHWAREFQQRDAVRRLLPEMADDDVILLCDVDEFVDPAALWPIILGIEHGPRALAMEAYYCGTRWRHATARWTHAKACHPRDLPLRPSEDLRNGKTFPMVLRAGWHLSFYGTADDWDQKLRAVVHEEVDGPEYRAMLHSISRGEFGDDWVDQPLTGPLRTILDTLDPEGSGHAQSPGRQCRQAAG